MDATYPDLRGASVFVTGGGQGIGAALTEGFAAQGARVAFVGRTDRTAFAAEVAARTGADVLYLPCDVTDTAALEAAMDRAAEAHGADPRPRRERRRRHPHGVVRRDARRCGTRARR